MSRQRSASYAASSACRGVDIDVKQVFMLTTKKPKRPITVGSLFAGVAGMDLGLERAGMETVWRVERDRQCRSLLLRYQPHTPVYETIEEFIRLDASPVDCICGGDPCPRHSRARSNSPAIHPDLAGYFLAVVGRYKPQWVVRENVPAPTTEHFAAALEAFGYGTVIIRMDGAEITGQSRQRDFVCGCFQRSRLFVRQVFADAEDGAEPYTTRLGTRPIAPCLTTNRTRYDSRDCYIWEEAAGLRILDANEREALAGLPAGWTAGFSEATRARMCGNAVIPAKAQWIGRRIIEADAG